MRTNKEIVIGSGAIIGTLGGLIGLGGAEFRLPLLIGLFRFSALEAVIINKASSLIVVLSALLFRTRTIPLNSIISHWDIIINLLIGSLIGAWYGASWAVRLKSHTFYRIIAVLLIGIACVLLFGHHQLNQNTVFITGMTQQLLGVIFGFIIGVIASLLGVAGGEFLIPTLVLLYGLDIKLAGSLSLAISLPTMLTGFIRYSRDNSFVVLQKNHAFVLLMAIGSLIGTFIGGLLLGSIANSILLPLLALILLISSVKVWQHA